MRRWLLVVSLFMLASVARADAIRGSWRLTPNIRGLGLQLQLNYDHSNWGHTVRADQFRGLDANAMAAGSETPARFQLARDAGTFDFTGTFLDGDGVGRFTFTPDASYVSRLQSMGVTSSELTDERLLSLASLDVSASFIHDMQALGYRESLERYVTFRIHGVSPDFVRAMQSAGYSNLSAEQLVTFRIHGVSPEFVRDMKAAGYDNLTAERLVTFRIHGVSTEFAKSMRDLGVKDLSGDQLVAMRIHGVSSDYVRELADLGYRDLSSEDLVRMRIHGVSTQFIRDLADAGYRNIPVEKLVAMKIHGVDADFVRKVK
jgi:hypothetical protein